MQFRTKAEDIYKDLTASYRRQRNKRTKVIVDSTIAVNHYTVLLLKSKLKQEEFPLFVVGPSHFIDEMKCRRMSQFRYLILVYQPSLDATTRPTDGPFRRAYDKVYAYTKRNLIIN